MNIIHWNIIKAVLKRNTLDVQDLPYVKNIEDTEKYIKIDYAFDVKFKKGSLYDISYVTEAKEFTGSYEAKDIANQTIHAGKCRYVCTERILSNESFPSYRFIFKKVKNR